MKTKKIILITIPAVILIILIIQTLMPGITVSIEADKKELHYGDTINITTRVNNYSFLFKKVTFNTTCDEPDYYVDVKSVESVNFCGAAMTDVTLPPLGKLDYKKTFIVESTSTNSIYEMIKAEPGTHKIYATWGPNQASIYSNSLPFEIIK